MGNLTKAQRRAREATFQKCIDCGNVIGLQQIADGKVQCRRCEEIAEAEAQQQRRNDFIDRLMAEEDDS